MQESDEVVSDSEWPVQNNIALTQPANFAQTSASHYHHVSESLTSPQIVPF